MIIFLIHLLDHCHFFLEIKLLFFTLSHQRKTSGFSLVSSYIPSYFTYIDIDFNLLHSLNSTYFKFQIQSQKQSDFTGLLRIPTEISLLTRRLRKLWQKLGYCRVDTAKTAEHTCNQSYPGLSSSFKETINLWNSHPLLTLPDSTIHLVLIGLWFLGTMQASLQEVFLVKVLGRGFIVHFPLQLAQAFRMFLLAITCLNFQSSITHNSA